MTEELIIEASRRNSNGEKYIPVELGVLQTGFICDMDRASLALTEQTATISDREGNSITLYPDEVYALIGHLVRRVVNHDEYYKKIITNYLNEGADQ